MCLINILNLMSQVYLYTCDIILIYDNKKYNITFKK